MWLQAIQCGTLTLALCPCLIGTALACREGCWKPGLSLHILLTIAALQSVANLANDYGDSLKARVPLQNPHAKGRLVQQKQLSAERMHRWIKRQTFLAAGLGFSLIQQAQLQYGKLLFCGLGVLSIWSALAYTLGRRPYGYRAGWGDLSVFLFFGPVGVLGTLFLQSQTLSARSWAASVVVGTLVVSILNLNHLRDWEEDALNRKQSLVLRYGFRWGCYYHWGLLGAAVAAAVPLLWSGSLQRILLGLIVCLLLISGRYVKQCPKEAALPILERYFPRYVQMILWVHGLLCWGLLCDVAN